VEEVEVTEDGSVATEYTIVSSVRTSFSGGIFESGIV